MCVQENVIIFWKREREVKFLQENYDSLVRSCRSHCKSERAFCHVPEANKGLGLAFGYQEFLLQELGAEWFTHNGHSEHRI